MDPMSQYPWGLLSRRSRNETAFFAPSDVRDELLRALTRAIGAGQSPLSLRTRRTPRQRRLLNGLTQLFRRSHEGAFEHWPPQAHGPAAHATYAHTRPTRPQWPNCPLVGRQARPDPCVPSYGSRGAPSAQSRADCATDTCSECGRSCCARTGERRHIDGKRKTRW